MKGKPWGLQTCCPPNAGIPRGSAPQRFLCFPVNRLCSSPRLLATHTHGARLCTPPAFAPKLRGKFKALGGRHHGASRSQCLSSRMTSSLPPPRPPTVPASSWPSPKLPALTAGARMRPFLCTPSSTTGPPPQAHPAAGSPRPQSRLLRVLRALWSRGTKRPFQESGFHGSVKASVEKWQSRYTQRHQGNTL